MSVFGEPRGTDGLTVAGEPWRLVSGEDLRDAACQALLSLAAPLAGSTFHVSLVAVRGRRILSPGPDEAWFADGIRRAYVALGSGVHTVAPSADGGELIGPLPDQITIRAGTATQDPHLYEVKLHVTTGERLRGHLFQETKATLNPSAWDRFLRRALPEVLATAEDVARLSVVVGGTSAEQCLAAAADADTGLLDALPAAGNGAGHSLRDPALEATLIGLVQELTGLNLRSARVVRQVRHGGSLPVAIHVGCGTDRRLTLSI